MATATTQFCRCSMPGVSVNPRKAGSCLSCSRQFNPEWISSDKTMGELFRRLTEAMPYGEAIEKDPATGADVLTEDFLVFKAQCLERERAGRYSFGLKYLRRDNAREALEEACDFALYLLLDTLKEVRDHGEDEDIDVVLTAARYAFKAFTEARRLRHKRHGAPA